MSGVRPASRGKTWNRTRQPGPSGPSAPTHTCGSSFPSSTSGSSIPAGLGKGLEKFWGTAERLGSVSSAGTLPPRDLLVSYLQQQEFLQWFIPLQQKQAGRQGSQQESAARIGVPNCGKRRCWAKVQPHSNPLSSCLPAPISQLTHTTLQAAFGVRNLSGQSKAPAGVKISLCSESHPWARPPLSPLRWSLLPFYFMD